jgi:hypothetical protein
MREAKSLARRDGRGLTIYWRVSRVVGDGIERAERQKALSRGK